MFAGTDIGAAFDWATLLDGVQRADHELLLFAAFWFIIGTIDELAVDFTWLWLKLTGRARERRLAAGFGARRLEGRAAVLVPAWHEAEVIGAMVRHTLSAWVQRELTLYVGCYANDAATVAAVIAAADGDPRLRVVIHDRAGPTTKADCLNRLYAALCDDEVRQRFTFRTLVLHDAEDMVHADALALIDQSMGEVDFVQLPVRPEPQADSIWIAGHYGDEFTEAHAKTLVVRDALRAAIPAAGVGCGFARDAIGKLAMARRAAGEAGPFSAECLTEDYELGLVVSSERARGRFLRCRDATGQLVATRAYFPATLGESVRQKTRWVHGIAFQGWDRLGWSGRLVDLWMEMRDRRGPLTALVLAAAYSLIVVEGVLALARTAGWHERLPLPDALQVMLTICFASFVWRSVWRFAFTAREYGLAEGVLAVLRVPVVNVITIIAGRRALWAYLRSLAGGQVTWDKTRHTLHPAAIRTEVAA